MLARVRSSLSLEDLWRALPPGDADPLAALESAFAARFGFSHALLFPYGRSALHALLTALGWHEREVLCPAYICAEVPYAATAARNRIRLVDSAADHFLPGIAEWTAAATPRSAMAIVTPLFGYPVDPGCERVVRAAAPQAFVLYDESLSYGFADAQGYQARSADGVLFSLGLGKMVTALSGGVLLLRDPAIDRAVRQVRDAQYAPPATAHTLALTLKGVAAWLALREPALSLTDYLGRKFGLFAVDAQDWVPSEQSDLPSDGRIMPSPLQARIGLRQFAKLDAFIAARRKTGMHYEQRLRAEGLRTFGYAQTPTWPRYPFAITDRDVTTARLRDSGIQVSQFLPYSCADLPAYKSQAVSCPNAALWGSSMINLPNWHGLTIAQADRVVDALVRIRERDPHALAWPGGAI